ncbi:MAG: hypothetical protein WC789_14495 [Lentisphaeria bacterium]
MNVRQIVTEYLTEHGFDGLYDPDSGECACLVAPMPGASGVMGLCNEEDVGDRCHNCVPGYLQTEDEAKRHGFDFMLGPDKPPSGGGESGR